MATVSSGPERFCYPAIFTYQPNQEIAVLFPDLDVATQGTDEAEAVRMAKDLLKVVLLGLTADGEEVPVPSAVDELLIETNERAVPIDITIAAAEFTDHRIQTEAADRAHRSGKLAS